MTLERLRERATILPLDWTEASSPSASLVGGQIGPEDRVAGMPPRPSFLPLAHQACGSLG
jgi:hypothetical protein